MIISEQRNGYDALPALVFSKAAGLDFYQRDLVRLAARVVKESGDSGVELEQAAESVATANGSALRRYVGRREEEKIAFTLGASVQKGDDIEYPAGLSANPAEACRTETR